MKSKEQKNAEAIERQSAARTPEQQLAYLDKMGFTATKERAKLQERINPSVPPVPKTPKSETTEKVRKGKATPKGKAAKKKN